MEQLVRPTYVEARPNYRIYLEFSDGAKGEVDLSNLAGRGVFVAWQDSEFFEQVHIGNHREIKWNEELELCPDSLYLTLTERPVEEVFPGIAPQQSHA